MPPIICQTCNTSKATLKRPKTGKAICKECFLRAFEDDVHQTITDNGLFKQGDKVAIGASGGKDSTVLAYVMKLLNDRHSYGLELFLLSVDEGIAGYRDDSLETVKRNETVYGIPLKIVSYKELYGWTMDEVVKMIGLKNNCTYCGVFRRQALDRGAAFLGCTKLTTGHNADDVAETVIMNIMRGDIARLKRCTSAQTDGGGEGTMPRVKPFKHSYEKEIVMYAHIRKLDYFSTECSYSPMAYRGKARQFIKDVERARPSSIVDIIRSGEVIAKNIKDTVKMPVQRNCNRCGYVSSMPVCQACELLDGLNSGLPRLGVGQRANRRRRHGKETCSKSDKSTTGVCTGNCACANTTSGISVPKAS